MIYLVLLVDASEHEDAQRDPHITHEFAVHNALLPCDAQSGAEPRKAQSPLLLQPTPEHHPQPTRDEQDP